MSRKRKLDERDMFTFQLSRVPPKGYQEASRREDKRCAELGDPGYIPISSRLRQRKIHPLKNKGKTELARLRLKKGDELDELAWKKVQKLGKVARKKEEKRKQREKEKNARLLIAQAALVENPILPAVSGGVKPGRQKLTEYACFQCRVDQRSEYGLDAHAMSTGHLLQCGECELKCSTPSRMGSHIAKKKHHMQCGLCKKRYKSVKLWRAHLFRCPRDVRNVPLMPVEPAPHDAPREIKDVPHDEASDTGSSEDNVSSDDSQSTQSQSDDESELDIDIKTEPLSSGEAIQQAHVKAEPE